MQPNTLPRILAEQRAAADNWREFGSPRIEMTDRPPYTDALDVPGAVIRITEVCE